MILLFLHDYYNSYSIYGSMEDLGNSSYCHCRAGILQINMWLNKMRRLGPRSLTYRPAMFIYGIGTVQLAP